MRYIATLSILLTGTGWIQAADIPDLTKGEGPAIDVAAKNDWFLHCDGCRGWAYRDATGGSDAARQILVTKVPAESAVRRDLKVGDVILGVNGESFSGHAIRQFRAASHPAQAAQGRFSVLLWRPGWDGTREVQLSLVALPLDFTRGDRPGEAADWNLGPTGARGWLQARNLATSAARQILVTAVEAGSPAEGRLAENDVIVGIGDAPFETDARKALAAAIRHAETENGHGRLNLLRWRDGKTETITITLPVLGGYSATAPFDCEKSETIMNAAAAYIVTNGMHDGINGCVNALGLLATGEKQYVPAVKAFAMRLKTEGVDMPTWNMGYSNLLLAEYYLATGDKDANHKLGALTALQHQGTRAEAAVPLLTGLLTHDDSSIRIAAIHALKGIGRPARAAVPELLRVARMTFPDDPRNLTRRTIGSVLFNDELLDVDAVDRKALFAAVRDLVRVDDGRARGQVAWLYKQLGFDDLKPILPDILWAVENPSPSGIMFAAGIRDAGLKLLSANRV